MTTSLPILGPTLETERLILRPPKAEDFDERAAQSADEQTMRYIGGVLEPAMYWRGFAAQAGSWALRGYGFFSVLEKASKKVVGSVGPHFPHQWPGQEVGWVIGREFWRQGFGHEAAMAAMEYTFVTLQWEQVIHVISPKNQASQALAASLGSKHLTTIDHLAGFGEVTNMIWGQSRQSWQKRNP